MFLQAIQTDCILKEKLRITVWRQGKSLNTNLFTTAKTLHSILS